MQLRMSMKKIRRYARSLISGTNGNRRALQVAPDSPAMSRWAIGVFHGSNLMQLREKSSISNPIFSAKDIHDRHALFVADPFIIREESRWYLFFEFFDIDLNRGVIGYAESSDGLTWKYKNVVLQEDFHLSYPYVFSHEGSYYMIPETKKTNQVRLYKAVRFPDKWEFVKTILTGRYSDSTVFHDGNLWWLFTSKGAYSLTLFYAEDLLGEWHRHRKRFIYFRNKARSRPGGRIVRHEGQLLRFSQDAKIHYGHQLRAFVIDKLTPTEYKEHEVQKQPFLSPALTGWNSVGMHTFDPIQLSDGSWMAIVDGTG